MKYRVIYSFFVGLFILGVSSLVTSCAGNEQPSLFFDQKKIKEYILLERGLQKNLPLGIHENSIAMNLNEEVRRDSIRTNIQFLRTTSNIPLRTYYYFDPADSMCQFIVYEWNAITPKLEPKEIEEIGIKEEKELDKYVSTFNSVAQQIANSYGLANEGDGRLHRENFEMLDIWKAHYGWKLKDKRIKLDLVWIPRSGYRIFKVMATVHFSKITP